MPLVCQLSPSCALVRLRGYHVLLLRGDPQGLPVSGEALGTIDTVLVSSASAMLMLPSLTQAAGFRGQVVATAAALRLGEQLLLERVALHAAAREHSLEVAGSAPDQQSSAADVAACVGRVKSVSFGERVELSCSVHAVALPAGCGIGAAVWSVQAAGERIVLASACSPPPELFNGQGGSAQLSEGTRQRPGQASSLADASAWLAVSACRPMRPASALCAADLLLLGGLRRTATQPPAEALRTACTAACDACARGVPWPPPTGAPDPPPTPPRLALPTAGCMGGVRWRGRRLFSRRRRRRRRCHCRRTRHHPALMQPRACIVRRERARAARAVWHRLRPHRGDGRGAAGARPRRAHLRALPRRQRVPHAGQCPARVGRAAAAGARATTVSSAPGSPPRPPPPRPLAP